MRFTARIGSIGRRALKPLGLTISRIRAPEPTFSQLDIFELCAADLTRKIQAPFVLQIGANDGIRFDPIRRFLVSHDWKGLLIEPNPAVFRDLVTNYKDFANVRLLNAAIGELDGDLRLYAPRADIIESKPELSGLCSALPNVLVNTLAFYQVPNPEKAIETFLVSSLSVNTLLSNYEINCIDVLQIDTEGYDWKILSQFDLFSLKVRLINMEFQHLAIDEQFACVRHLEGSGFRLARNGLDLVAYRS